MKILENIYNISVIKGSKTSKKFLSTKNALSALHSPKNSNRSVLDIFPNCEPENVSKNLNIKLEEEDSVSDYEASLSCDRMLLNNLKSHIAFEFEANSIFISKYF